MILKNYSIVIVVSMVMLTACAFTPQKLYTQNMIDERPKTILIMPPMNETTAADAPLFLSTTLFEPLVWNGYYVIPYDVSTDILLANGFISSEDVVNADISMFYEYFGADALLFTKITSWNTVYAVLAATLQVGVEYQLRSTKSGAILWETSKIVTINLTQSNSSGGIFGLLAQAIATSIATAVADYTPYAKKLNFDTISSMPYGAYHSEYMKDIPVADNSTTK